MKSLFLKALAACVLAAGTAHAAERVCEGRVEAESGTTVEVRFTIDDRGAVKSREATWTLASPSGGLAAITGEPVVSVHYEAPTEQGVGAAATVGAFSMTMTEDGRYFSGAVFAIDAPDGRQWTDREPMVAFATGGEGVVMVMAMGELEAAAAPDLFADLEQMGQSRVSFRRGDEVLKGIVVDFRTRTERDQLYPQAWAAATKAAERPRRCKREES